MFYGNKLIKKTFLNIFGVIYKLINYLLAAKKRRPTPRMRSQMSKIFISYSRRDAKIAEHLYSDLKADGHNPWIDTNDLLPGDIFDERIYEEIKTCDYFIALISTESLNNRGYVLREIRMALDVLEEIPYGKRFLIPVRLDDCHPKDKTLARIHWVDIFPEYTSGFKRISAAIDQETCTDLQSYSKVGILAPAQLSTWDDQRLFVYFSEELWSESINRAERDFEGFDETGLMQLVHERAIDKARAFAKVNGVFEAWQRYEEKRFRESHNQANSADAKGRAVD